MVRARRSTRADRHSAWRPDFAPPFELTLKRVKIPWVKAVGLKATLNVRFCSTAKVAGNARPGSGCGWCRQSLLGRGELHCYEIMTPTQDCKHWSDGAIGLA